MKLLNVLNLMYRHPNHNTLENVSLTVRAGETVGVICSEHSAGAALLECIAGGRARNAVTIYFKTRPIKLFSPETRIDLGIRRVPEPTRLCPLMTTLEILEAGGLTTRTSERIAEMLGRVFTLLPSLTRIRQTQFINLTSDEQYLVSIGQTLMADPTLFLLDTWPMTGHSHLWSEVSHALDTVAACGTAILAVVPAMQDHPMHIDRLYTLQNGRTIPHYHSSGHAEKRQAA